MKNVTNTTTKLKLIIVCKTKVVELMKHEKELKKILLQKKNFVTKKNYINKIKLNYKKNLIK